MLPITLFVILTALLFLGTIWLIDQRSIRPVIYLACFIVVGLWCMVADYIQNARVLVTVALVTVLFILAFWGLESFIRRHIQATWRFWIPWDRE